MLTGSGGAVSCTAGSSEDEYSVSLNFASMPTHCVWRLYMCFPINGTWVTLSGGSYPYVEWCVDTKDNGGYVKLVGNETEQIFETIVNSTFTVCIHCNKDNQYVMSTTSPTNTITVPIDTPSDFSFAVDVVSVTGTVSIDSAYGEAQGSKKCPDTCPQDCGCMLPVMTVSISGVSDQGIAGPSNYDSCVSGPTVIGDSDPGTGCCIGDESCNICYWCTTANVGLIDCCWKIGTLYTGPYTPTSPPNTCEAINTSYTLNGPSASSYNCSWSGSGTAIICCGINGPVEYTAGATVTLSYNATTNAGTITATAGCDGSSATYVLTQTGRINCSTLSGLEIPFVSQILNPDHGQCDWGSSTFTIDSVSST
jgi:hypothetical protein